TGLTVARRCRLALECAIDLLFGDVVKHKFGTVRAFGNGQVRNHDRHRPTLANSLALVVDNGAANLLAPAAGTAPRKWTGARLVFSADFRWLRHRECSQHEWWDRLGRRPAKSSQ